MIPTRWLGWASAWRDLTEPCWGSAPGCSCRRYSREARSGHESVPALGYQPVEVLDEDGLLGGLGPNAVAYQHHYWEVVNLPEDFVIVARSEDCRVEAVRSPARNWWGTQFHPERFSARHPDGERVLRNFFSLAGVSPRDAGGQTSRAG